MSSAALLEVEGLASGYGKLQILSEISFLLAAGQSTVLLGPNGAGKTTLLRTLVGLLPLWSGEIRYQGRELGRLPPEVRVALGISFMSELGVFPSLSIRENLVLGGFGLPAHLLRRRVKEMLDLFPDLASRPGAPAGSLSGGQRKMLGVAKALVRQPKLLIMDEPSAGLSPLFVNKVIELLRRFQGQELALLIAEQNVRFLDLAEQVIILEGGRIQAAGPTGQVTADDRVRRAYFSLDTPS